MAEKSFGVKDLNIVGASGDPTIESNGDLNLKAGQVAIQTNTTITGVINNFQSESPSGKLLSRKNIELFQKLSLEDPINKSLKKYPAKIDPAASIISGVTITAGDS